MSDSDKGAWVCRVQRFMPRCFVCGWDGPPMMKAEAEACVLGHNITHHPEALVPQ